MKKKITWMAKKLYFIAAALIIVIALLLSIGRISAPLLSDYKPKVESFLSQELHLPVKIGHIELNWYGFMPMVRLDNVSVFHSSHPSPIVDVQQFYVGIDLLRSLFSRYWQTGQLAITGVSLIFSQNESGNWQLHGMTEPLFDFDSFNQDESRLMSWLLQQHNVILDQVSIKSLQTNGRAVDIAQLRFSMQNTADKHHLKGQMLFPDDNNAHLQWVLHLEQNKLHTSDWNGRFYAEGDRIPLYRGLNAFLSRQLYAQGGMTNFDISGDIVNSRLNELNGEFFLDDLMLYANNSKEAFWHLTKASTQLNSRPLGPNLREFLMSSLKLDVNNHRWPKQTLSWQQDTSVSNQNKNELKIDFIQLEDIYPLALIFKDTLKTEHATLSALNPSGAVKGLTVEWQQTATKPITFNAHLNFDKVNIQHWANIPGVKNLSGVADFSQNQGSLQLASQSTVWSIPKVFRSPLILTSLNANLTWEKKPQTLEVELSQFAANFPQGKAKAKMKLIVPDDENQSPWMDVQGEAAVDQITNAELSGYLPVSVMPKAVVKWLDNSLKFVGSSTADVVLQGTIKDFPYDEGNGVFTIHSKLKEGTLDYAEGWPFATRVNGELLFSGRRMQANLTAGEISGIQIKQAYAEIPKMSGKEPVWLNIRGKGEGDLSAGLRFIQKSPLAKSVGQQLRDFEGNGSMAVNLELTLPLGQPTSKIKPNLKGALILDSAQVALPEWHVLAKNVKGDVQFTENSVFATDLKAKLWDWPTTISFKNQQQGKKDELHVEFVMPDAAQGKVNFATEEKGLRLTNGHIHFGHGSISSVPPVGLLIDGEIPLLDLTSSNASIAPPSADEFNGILALLQQVDLRIKELRLPSTTFTSLQIIGQSSEQGWEAQLKSPQLEGALSYQANRPQPWWLTLQQLSLTLNTTSTPETKTSNSSPQMLPAFRFTCTHFEWDKKQLGEVTIIAEKVPQGLNFKTVTAKSKDTQLIASGSWLGDAKKQRSTLHGKITSTNTVNTLKAWEMPSNMVSQNASLSFNLNWLGEIYRPKLTQIQGDVGISIKDGFIVGLSEETTAKMNLGRVLNLLSWQDLPKRLQLNFQDLTHKGYAFSKMKGDYNLKNGTATTMNTQIEGSVADMQLVGEIGLVAQNYHLILTVIPNLTSSLPIVATLAAGPIAGAITWVVDTVLGSQVNKMSRYTYEVTGPWQEPKVEPISHSEAKNAKKTVSRK